MAAEGRASGIRLALSKLGPVGATFFILSDSARTAIRISALAVIAGLESFRERMNWFLQHRPNLAQNVARWRDCIPFHEYFHGDNGYGVGASHQTGWTALIASLLFEYGGQHASA